MGKTGLDINTFHEGIVMKNAVANMNCCVPHTEDEIVFRYLAITCEDGEVLMAYSDRKGFAEFERNFHSMRFTAYHEFFTTTRRLTECRGNLKLDYYERRPDSCYRVAENLDEAMKSFGEEKRGETHITILGQYAKSPEEDRMNG
ncbi:MAG: hypothetical protein MRZ36_00395 [Eubacterium sp.]|nr:hypothetical protein [Eubacterium sp.]